MLEKIGLPPKPSLRGNNWVVDASHCQGCASQFTFINRKHHCRRCGGIYCGTCTQQRMVLRGQGDSPVRICEPCKKLEDAARFEMRQGYKNRSAKGNSKLGSKKEDENEAKLLSKQITGSSSSSSIRQTGVQAEEDDIVRSSSLDQPTWEDLGSATPDELREQALLEKQKHKTLKAEGKSEEALRAFKRGKELERQAAALEISLRKLRKRALSTTNLDDAQGAKVSNRVPTEKNRPSSDKSKKDDLSAELRELGWSDADLHDAEKKPATMTVEGELFSLLREVSQKPNKEKQSINPDKSQVLAHKKKALELKRAGNVMEAKEELKKAKILERKIEEEELLGEADDSDDDELSSLMRSLDSESGKHDDLSSRYKSDINFDFNQFAGIGDDLGVDGNFDVTDDDLADPEMASALKSLGWEEDASDPEDIHVPASSSSRESLLSEIQSLKREALHQKRAGNTSEAMALLKKAKVLEMDVSTSEAQDSGLKDSTTGKKTITPGDDYRNQKLASKSKLTIQKELIAMKKKALALRRDGRLDESGEELRKAKALEQQLEEMNAAALPPMVTQTNAHRIGQTSSAIVDSEDVDEEVTDQDLNDPSYLSLLKNLGWDEDVSKVPSSTSKEKEDVPSSDSVSKEEVNSFNAQNVAAGMQRKSRSEIQRELLALKRKALNLRRQGDVEAADEVLNSAKLLEAQLQEYDKPATQSQAPEDSGGHASIDVPQHTELSYEKPMTQGHTPSEDSGRHASIDVPQHNKSSPEIGELKKQDNVRHETPKESRAADSSPQKLDNHASNSSQVMDSSPRQEILAHKRKALLLKREGKLAEAKEELRLAKLLEKRAEEEEKVETSSNPSPAAAPVPDVSSSEKKEANPSPPKLLTSRERFKLQQESLGHKRQALKLRREGKTAEADALFELAKSIEAQLEESHDTSKSGEATDDVSVEDFLDPQLLSALQSIGIQEARPTPIPTPTVTPTPTPPTPIPTSQGKSAAKSNGSDGGENTESERKQLTERIKAEKIKAVNLKRSGKQAEALDALRRAKLYEKKLQALNPN